MSQVFEKAAEANKTGIANVVKNASSLARTNQTAGIEWADFARESYAAGAETMKKLAAARSLPAIFEIQSAYLKGSYERLQSQAKVMTDLYQGFAQEVSAPLQGNVPFDLKTFFDPKAFFDTKTLFDPNAFFGKKTFFDAKSPFDPKTFSNSFPTLPGSPAADRKLAA